MQTDIILKLLPSEAAHPSIIRQYLAASLSKNEEDITGFYKLKQSIDARAKQPYVNLVVRAFIGEPFIERDHSIINFSSLPKHASRVIIIGAGPAGLFAALRLIELGIKPIILERGKDVRARRRDLATLNKEGVINPESNYCFGEGGAGTYSDGKLYTRSNKRGDINRILNLFVQFGAEDQILYEAHPHIGTNKLPQIITAMRHAIEAYGGEFHFEKKVTKLLLNSNVVKGVLTAEGDQYDSSAIILATGHSARDIYLMLHSQQILIEAKPFALGVRVEHPQTIIDQVQYGRGIKSENITRDTFLPPASYSLVQQVADKGVFSFCMCPGGIIAPAATNNNELVVNGWSPSKRNNPFANSGIVVSCDQKDLSKVDGYKKYLQSHSIEENSPLALMYFQQMVEQMAYETGGGKFVAPAQRLVDFCTGKVSNNLPDCSYLPGIASSALGDCLPAFIHKRLQQGFKSFGIKMQGYYTNEAVVVATESRTSSPVRIPRNLDTLRHPQVKNLYPCGEGAGYAGGIVSSAMDGEKVATMLAATLVGS